jgi:hypothetical protein
LPIDGRHGLAACRTWVCILPEVAAGDAGAV